MNGDDIRAFCERNSGIDAVCRHKLLQAAAALDAARERAVPEGVEYVILPPVKSGTVRGSWCHVLESIASACSQSGSDHWAQKLRHLVRNIDWPNEALREATAELDALWERAVPEGWEIDGAHHAEKQLQIVPHPGDGSGEWPHECGYAVYHNAGEGWEYYRSWMKGGIRLFPTFQQAIAAAEAAKGETDGPA